MVFGSRSLWIHLLRGAAGATALWLSLITIDSDWLPSLLLMPIALWMFRGCPVCWSLGLFESAAQLIHRMSERASPDS